MDDRLQRVLDGDLAREALGPGELKELARIEGWLRDVGRTVPAGSLPDLGPSVLARIRNLDPPSPAPAWSRTPWSRAVGWLWTPRPVAFAWRPAYAFSAAAVVLALILGPARVPLPDAATVAVPAEVLVQFRLDAPQAQVVTLAGDFTGWQQAHPLKRSEPGVWTVVVPLEPGVHDYAFIVDGERWMPDPMAPAVSDGFGGLNSRISVLAPDSRRPL